MKKQKIAKDREKFRIMIFFKICIPKAWIAENGSQKSNVNLNECEN